MNSLTLKSTSKQLSVHMLKKVYKIISRDYLYTIGTGWLFTELIIFLVENWNTNSLIIDIVTVFLLLIVVVTFSSLAFNSIHKSLHNWKKSRKHEKPEFGFDSWGNEVYYNNNDDYWLQTFYNADGMLLGTYDSNNEWNIYEYDKEGNKIKLITSTGFVKHFNEVEEEVDEF